MPAKRKSMTLCLIRSGETTWARQNRLVGAADLPLSNAGRSLTKDDSMRMARAGVPTIHHPTDESATATARIFAEAMHARCRGVAELRDPHLGLLEGMTVEEFEDRYAKRSKQWHDDLLSFIAPEGEDMREARARIFRAVAKAMKRSRSEETAVVLHPLGLGLLRCWLADRPAAALWDLIDQRPRVERYVLSMTMIDQLEAIPSSELSRT